MRLGRKQRPIPRFILPIVSSALALMLTACAGGPDGGLTTSSVTPQKTAASRPSIDPACVTLASQIRSARDEGTPARVQAAAAGKTKTVRVKRESLAKLTELDRLNSEFQSKCSKVPGLNTAAAPTTIAPKKAAAAGNTVVASKAPVATIAKPVVLAPSTPIVAVPK